MNKTRSIVLAGMIVVVALASCDSGNLRRDPGHVYAPDMYYSRAYDAYTSNPNFADSQTSRPPVPGTIARGHELPDHLQEGDTVAYKTFTTAERFSDDEIKEGGRLFNIYCAVCHGSNLDGQGPLYASGKFASAPANFKDAKYLHLPLGQIYGAIKYGKNMMGSYASQLDIRQRWQIIAYIKQVQAASGGDALTLGSAPLAPVADTSKKAQAGTTAAKDAKAGDKKI